MNESTVSSEFNFPADAVLMAGGTVKNLPPEEPAVNGKGHIMIGDLPMSAHTLKALKASGKVGRIVLVTPQKKEDLGPEWEGADFIAPAGKSLMESAISGISALPEDSRHPILLTAGDLPFLTTEAVDDFLDQCAASPAHALWYAFVSKKVSQEKYPEVRHTWVKMAEGTFCGGGLTCIRREAMTQMRQALIEVTEGRKNPFKIAGMLGIKPLLYLLFGRLTVPMTEEAGARMLKVPCKGIVSAYAETACNVDDAESLRQARERMSRKN